MYNFLPKMHVVGKSKVNGLPIYELDEDFIYIFPWDNRQLVCIPKGTRTNFASIPKPFHWLIDPDGKDILLAALVHDYLVNEWGNLSDPYIILNYEYARRDYSIGWDKAIFIMKKIMKEEGAPTWKRFLVYWAVKIYGKFKHLD